MYIGFSTGDRGKSVVGVEERGLVLYYGLDYGLDGINAVKVAPQANSIEKAIAAIA